MSADPIAAWRAHPGFRESFIQATAEFMASADPEPAALRTGHVGPEGQHGSCIPPSTRPSGSFAPAAPSTRRAGRTPARTTNLPPTALPVAEEGVA